MAYSRFEVQPGKNKDLCLKLDRNTIRDAATKGTHGMNTVYYICLMLFLISFFIVLVGLTFTLFLSSTQSEAKKLLFARMYMYASVFLVIGTIILWFVYLVGVRKGLRDTT
jgi:hypothetical protein